MKLHTKRAALVVCGAIAIIMVWVAIASATGAPVVTWRAISALDNSLNIAVSSTGDAGGHHGNVNPWTSPVDASGSFYWFNQPVTVTEFNFPDVGNGIPVFSGATYAINTGSGYSAPVPFPAPYTAEYEGVYSIVATGTDNIPADVSGEITPAFGIDQTEPTVSTNAVPFYAGTPVVTITATDTLSGVQDVVLWVDGLRNYAWEPDPIDPGNFTGDLNFIGEGLHTIDWVGHDNAGNAAKGSVSFRIDNTAPVTTSDLVSVYDGDAVITLSGDDGVDGSGVAHTYYALDGGAPVEGTTVNVPAPADTWADHTIEFWSVDAVGNEETPHQTGNFRVNSVHGFTALPSTSGTITPAGTTMVGYGSSSPTYHIVPKTGYHITDVLVDGISVGKASTYATANVTAPHTIAATFAINKYTLTPSRNNTHGTITPGSKVTNSYGTTKTFTMKPASGYKIQKVLVDGHNVGAVSSYKFTNINANHAIKVYFIHK